MEEALDYLDKAFKHVDEYVDELRSEIRKKYVYKGKLFKNIIKNISSTNLVISPIFMKKEQKNYWVSSEEFKLKLDCFEINVPVKSVSDGASIPRNASRVLPSSITSEVIIVPAFVHDYLYSKDGKILKNGKEQEYNRQDADIVFKSCIFHFLKDHLHVGTIATLCYYGVYIGGKSHFKKEF